MQVTTLSTQLGLGSELVDGIEMQSLFPLVVCSLICRRGRTVEYIIAQTVVLFRQNFTFPNV